MTIHSTLTSLVLSAHAGRTGPGIALVYALTGIISATMYEVAFNHFECEKAKDYRRLRWTVVGTKGLIRITILKEGKIKFRLHNRRGDRGTGTTYLNIHSMIREFRRYSEKLKSEATLSSAKRR